MTGSKKSKPSTPAVPTQPPKDPVAGGMGERLAWGAMHPDWDKALYDSIRAKDWSSIQMPVPELHPHDNVAHLISIMAKYESSWDPKTKYEEQGHLAGVTSRGLMQLSFDSCNQKAYDCKLANPQQLHDPYINLWCAVRIMHYQAKKHGVLFNGDKHSGAGAYWSVGRSTSGSYLKIKKYMEGL